MQIILAQETYAWSLIICIRRRVLAFYSDGKLSLLEKPYIDCDKISLSFRIGVFLNQKVVIWLILPVAYAYLGD
jgi:hypothetical protein